MSDQRTDQFDRRLPVTLAAVGLLLSAWLEFVHLKAHTEPSATSFCSVGPSFDCATVALSRWSVLLHIPVALWGVAGFLALGLLAWWRSRLLLPLAAVAALGSIALLGIELVSVHSVCLLCEGVHVTSVALLFVVWRTRHSLVHVDETTLAHIFTVPLGILASARFLMTPYWAAFSWHAGVHLPHGQEVDGAYWIGAQDPKVVVHEYTDYSCAHCAVATKSVRKKLTENPTSLRIVHHNYPRMRCEVSGGPLACLFARAANCGGEQGKFWEMDSWLFEHAPGRATLDFSVAAKDIHLDADKFSSCMASEKSFARADNEARAAITAHIVGAPSYVIDGKTFLGGEVLGVLSKRL